MKILAIRGANLASLAGDFAVDFTVAPLADAGLFAITGHTGAGKSTLLDALCLALYSEMPRLVGASRGVVGAHNDPTQQWAANKVGSILRHGAGRGHAEVDFQGSDGRPYRSRWEIWRTRNRPDGALQDPKLRLTDLLTGGGVGSTNTEVLAEIVRLTGLTFDQFRRSVLLAQGDFDAFLKAKPGERAALLELMTGTEIYGRLSVAAFERARAERLTLDDLCRDLAALHLLTDDQRDALVAAEATAREAAAASETALRGLEADQRWWERTAQLNTAVTLAEAVVTQALAQEAAAQPTRDALAAAERVAPLRPLLAELRRLAGERAAQKKQLEQARAAFDAGQAAAGLAEQAVAAAKAGETTAEQALTDAQPLLERAIALDTRLETAESAENAAQNALATARTDHAARQQALTETERALSVCQQASAAAADWLAAHADDLPLADELPRWLEKLGEWDAVRTRTATRNADAARQAAAADAARTLVRNLEADLAKLDDVLTTDRAARDALDEQLAGQDESALTARFTALGALDTLLSRLKAADDRVRHTEQVIERLTAQAGQARNDLRYASQSAAKLNDHLRAESARLEEAEQAYAVAEAAAGQAAEALRARLVAGQPCPVCGSTDHPLPHDAGALGDLLRQQRERVDALKQTIRQSQQQLATAHATEKSAQALLDQTAADLPPAQAAGAQAQAERSALQQRIGPAAHAANLPLPAVPDGLERIAIAVHAASSGTKAALEHAQSLRRQRDTLNRSVDAAAETRKAKAAALGEAERQLATATADGEAIAATLIELRQREAAAVAALAVPLQPITDWQSQPLDRLTAACNRLSAAVVAQRRQQEDNSRQAATLTVQLDGARQAVTASQAALETATTALATARDTHRTLLTDRRDLFDGRKVAAVRAELEQARTATRQATQSAVQSADLAVQQATATQTRLTTAEQAAIAVAAAEDAAQSALEAGIAGCGLDAALATEALGRDGEWISAARETLAGLADARRNAESVLAERRRTAAEHRTTPQPALAGDALDQATSDQRAILDAQRRTAAEHAARLLDDRRRRDQGAALQARMAAQQQLSDLWDGIADLIGAADGAKFRRFAQSLTLDRLLEQANHHLADLTPRYRLQRAPGGELDLQVIDRDMGGEIRSVAALSGGERFLTSLALALGLAGMTGASALVQSLFIDEGFGSLDAASLDVAISALETLQAAGRKIGVISHVQPMVERIGVRVQVDRLGGGRSAVSVVTG